MLRWYLVFLSLRVFSNIQILYRWKDHMAGTDFSPGKVSRIKKNLRQIFSLKKKTKTQNNVEPNVPYFSTL